MPLIVAVEAIGSLEREESPTKVRVTDKKRRGAGEGGDDSIATILSDEDDEESSPAVKEEPKVHGKSAALHALMRSGGDDAGSFRKLTTVDSNKHLDTSNMLRLSNSFGSDSLDSLAPPGASTTPLFKPSRFGSTTDSQPQPDRVEVTRPAINGVGPAGPSHRYDEINLSDDEDEGPKR